MNKCENCIHYEVCADMIAYYRMIDVEKVKKVMCFNGTNEKNCDHYKDKNGEWKIKESEGTE